MQARPIDRNFPQEGQAIKALLSVESQMGRVGRPHRSEYEKWILQSDQLAGFGAVRFRHEDIAAIAVCEEFTVGRPSPIVPFNVPKAARGPAHDGHTPQRPGRWHTMPIYDQKALSIRRHRKWNHVR